MNIVTLIGRLTKDPEIRVTNESQKSVARFSLAISRGKDKNGKDLGADFPNIVCFGKTAETAEKWLTKGKQIAISGHLHTDSYEKDGVKHYTTDVICDRIYFLADSKTEKKEDDGLPAGFSALTDEDIPF